MLKIRIFVRVKNFEGRRYFNLKTIAINSRPRLAQLTEKNNRNKINKTRMVALANCCYMRTCLCMDDAVTSSADVKPRLCIYLRTPRGKLRTREPFLVVVTAREGLGKQRLKGLRGVR